MALANCHDHTVVSMPSLLGLQKPMREAEVEQRVA
jgi:hypothetical protein